jgi:hypothetical protein
MNVLGTAGRPVASSSRRRHIDGDQVLTTDEDRPNLNPSGLLAPWNPKSPADVRTTGAGVNAGQWRP